MATLLPRKSVQGIHVGNGKTLLEPRSYEWKYRSNNKNYRSKGGTLKSCWNVEQQLGDGNIYNSKELPLKVDVSTSSI